MAVIKRILLATLVTLASLQAGCLASNVNLIDYKSMTTPKVRAESRSELKVYFEGMEKSSDERSLPVSDFNYAFKRHLSDLGAFTLVDSPDESDVTIGGKCSWNSDGSSFGYVMLDVLLGSFTLGLVYFTGIPWQWADGSSQIELKIRDSRSGKLITSYLNRSTKRVHAGLYYGWGRSAAGENANRVMRKTLEAVKADVSMIERKHHEYKDLPPSPEVLARLENSRGSAPLIERLVARQQPAQVAHKPVISGLTNQPIVAVFNIEDGSDSFKREALDQLTDYLCSKVASDAGFRVVPREQLRERIIEEKKESHAECYDGVCQIEMGRAMSAQMSLSTKIIRVGTKCAITSMLYDLRTETASTSATVRTGCSEDSLMDGIDRLVRQFGGR